MEREILLFQNSHGLGRQGNQYLTKKWRNAMTSLGQSMFRESMVHSFQQRQAPASTSLDLCS